MNNVRIELNRPKPLLNLSVMQISSNIRARMHDWIFISLFNDAIIMKLADDKQSTEKTVIGAREITRGIFPACATALRAK
jgi:hypothetical protein